MLRLALLVTLATGACGLRSRLRQGGSEAHDLALALQSGQPYRQRLENYHELIYHGSISFGGQVVQAVFDTGSFDVVVTSQRCKLCKFTPYNSEASKTHSPDPHNYTEEHNYVSGPTTTALAYETVSVGPLVKKNQSIFEVLSHNVSILDRGIFSAVVGIGPEGHNTSNPSLLKGFGITEYSLCLQRQAGSPGWLTWRGDLTPELKAASHELSVVGRYHWALSMRDMLPTRSRHGSLTDRQKQAAQTLLCGRGCAAILDSGTSLISAPSHALKGLKYLLPDLNDNCSNFDDLPDLEFSLSGMKLTLPPQAYAMRLVGTEKEKADVESLLHFKSKSSLNQSRLERDKCIYAFINLDHHTDYGPLWIFGMPFFRQFHVTFKMADKPKDRRVWLSGATDTCEPTPLDSSVDPDIDPYAKFKGYGVYPKVHVLSSQKGGGGSPGRGPLTIQARDVKPVKAPVGEL